MPDTIHNPVSAAAPSLWTVKDMAYYLNVSEWTVRELLRRPDFEGKIHLGRIIRIHPLTALRWIEAQSGKRNPS